MRKKGKPVQNEVVYIKVTVQHLTFSQSYNNFFFFETICYSINFEK